LAAAYSPGAEGEVPRDDPMIPALRAVIDEAYLVFADYGIGDDLVVYQSDVCMSVETKRALLRTPLAEIPAEILAEYTNSAHGWDDRVADEIRYFLPRYLELIAQDDPPDSMGMDICLRRLADVDWRKTWPEREAGVLDRFFDELLVAGLARLDLALWPAGWRPAHDIGDVLSLAVSAGGDAGRLLSAWDGAADPDATIHMAALRWQVRTNQLGDFWSCVYLENHLQAARDIGVFLTRPEATVRIEAALLTVQDERLKEILSAGL
jgi:hypothetical protein